MMQHIVVRTYIETSRHLVPEFWGEERVAAIRKMAETGMPHVELNGPARRGR